METAIRLVREVVGDLKEGIIDPNLLQEGTLLWTSEDGNDAGLGFDSLDILEVLMTLEERCEVELLDDIDPDAVPSVGSVARLVLDRVQASVRE